MLPHTINALKTDTHRPVTKTELQYAITRYRTMNPIDNMTRWNKNAHTDSVRASLHFHSVIHVIQCHAHQQINSHYRAARKSLNRDHRNTVILDVFRDFWQSP